MGYIMSIAMFGVWLTSRDVHMLYVSALFYIGASIASLRIKLDEDDEN